MEADEKSLYGYVLCFRCIAASLSVEILILWCSAQFHHEVEQKLAFILGAESLP